MDFISGHFLHDMGEKTTLSRLFGGSVSLLKPQMHKSDQSISELTF